ncbi:hypothetical protein AVEN_223892-1 [Araneus ventricosus]|uniref:Uncharacterized protein n=1 Tax=Araneus ventricosus TaxID=182803 RepID=A0A4Y1ZT48_ARAVE|nr:hypothetical protein AVEN_223892-1 [Araneus ventricosus]
MESLLMEEIIGLPDLRMQLGKKALTGTLTEDCLDISGVVPIDDGRFERAVKHLNHLPNSPLMKAMATCHSLTKVDGKLLGHTLDVKIFEAIRWVRAPLTTFE